ncbi:MAG TPA: heat-inducible transcriptional repressor HrcA [Gammaproteobacteria bacterium]|nr:heat-inducible transcriptional repressor HrcA [Gammaproteobacteria bacterium]
MTNELPINQRAQQVLKLLVERYIEEGLPVSSKAIAELPSLGLSSATIRNILAELEDTGYLSSLHTSSGRIPTAKGYRFFVNSLITVKPLESTEVQELKKQLDPQLNMLDLLQCTSSLLSGLTQLIGVVTLPRQNQITLQQIEFLPLSYNGLQQRVLAIIVLSDKEIQNRIIHTDKLYSQAELQQAANYLNTHYSGKSLLDIRKELTQAIQNDRENITQLIQTAIAIANKTFSSVDDNDGNYVIAGQANLFQYSQEIDLNRLRHLFEAFNQKQEILQLLSHSIEAEGIQIFIGQESGREVLNDWSVITMPYSVNGSLVGSLGVIGPARMPYERVISAVDVTSKLLSAVLNQG